MGIEVVFVMNGKLGEEKVWLREMSFIYVNVVGYFLNLGVS